MPGQTYAPYPNTGSAGTPNNDPGGLLVPLDAQIEQIKRELDHTRARLAEANTVVKHLAVRRDTLEAILAGLTTTRREAGKIANVPMVELQAGGMVVGHYPDPATYHPPRGHSDEINTPYPPPEQPMERRWDGTDPIVPPPNTR